MAAQNLVVELLFLLLVKHGIMRAFAALAVCVSLGVGLAAASDLLESRRAIILAEEARTSSLAASLTIPGTNSENAVGEVAFVQVEQTKMLGALLKQAAKLAANLVKVSVVGRPSGRAGCSIRANLFDGPRTDATPHARCLR